LKLKDDDLATKKLALDKLKVEIAKDEKRIDDLKKSVLKVSSSMFKDFSRSVGVDNIAEYEEKRLAQAEQRSKRKIELAEAESRLLGALEYEKSRDTRTLAGRMKSKIKTLKMKLKQKEVELKQFEGKIDKMKEDVKDKSTKLKSLKTEMEGKSSEISKVKSSSQDLKRKMGKLESRVIAIDAESEKLRSVRDEVKKQAIMDQVELPLKKGRRRADSKTSDWDFSALTENLDIESEEEHEKIKQQYIEEISERSTALQKIAPNLRAIEQFDAVEERLQNMKEDFDEKRSGERHKQSVFEEILARRTELFRKVFDHVKDNINNVYKELTRSRKYPNGGTAYLNLEDPEMPFASGIKYSAMPPGKRYRDIDQLSGGEKTVAALALLFAIHSCNPAPFFVLDEVDAALDSVNVNKVSNYVRGRTQNGSLQCIVISLKDTFYHKADSLVGIYKDQPSQSSGSLTLDLTEYDHHVQSERKEKKGSNEQKLTHSAVFGSQRSASELELSGSVAGGSRRRLSGASEASAASHRSRASNRSRTKRSRKRGRDG